MVGCAVYSCKRRSETANFTKDGVSYHTFPKDIYLRKDWILFCRRSDNWVPTRTSVICSDHFDLSCFQSVSKFNRRKLIETAKPTLISCTCKVSGTAHDNSAQLDSETGELSGDGNETSQEKEEIPEGKVLITRVYRYLLKEYETLKSTISMLDLQPLADILRRTSDATGVSQCTVLTVMEESKRPAGPYSDGDRKRKKVHMCDSLTTEDSCKESGPDIQNDVTSNPIVSAIPVMTVDIAPTTMQPPENIPEVKSEMTLAIDQTTLPPHASTKHIPEEQTQYKYPMHNLKAEPDNDSMHDQASTEQDPLQDNTSNMTEAEATICEVKTEPQDPPSSSQACSSAVSVPIKIEVMDQDNQPSTRSPAKFDGVQ